MEASTVIELERAATQEDVDAGLASNLGEEIAQDSELFLYEAVKASANGFLVATTRRCNIKSRVSRRSPLFRCCRKSLKTNFTISTTSRYLNKRRNNSIHNE